jgi:hypothetical protein
MEERLLEWLEELRGRDDVSREWSFGAIMGAYMMGVITRERRTELVNKYCVTSEAK